MGRILADAFLLLIFVCLGVAGILYYARHRVAPPEKDLGAVPSMWYTFSEEGIGSGYTIVGIQRVNTKTQEVLEKRRMNVIPDGVPNYSAVYDAAMDEAYTAMRVANVHLNRR